MRRKPVKMWCVWHMPKTYDAVWFPPDRRTFSPTRAFTQLLARELGYYKPEIIRVEIRPARKAKAKRKGARRG